jgi:Calcium-dependent channel, 7TM region, putative phosphate
VTCFLLRSYRVVCAHLITYLTTDSPFLHESDSRKLNSYRPPSIGAPRNPDGTLAAPEEHNSTSTMPTAEDGGLRSRSLSPHPQHPEVSDELEAEKMKPKKGAMAKAKHAIKQYSRLTRNVNFFGRPIHTSYKPSEGDIEDHVNEVTDKAFVVMRTFTASTIAIQSMHSSKPGSMQVVTAPEPRDILWENIYVSKGATRTRSYLGEMLVLLLIGFYVVPVALVSLLVSESALVSSSPRLAQLDQASAFFSSAIAMVQPLCIVGIQQLLPPLFIVIGRLEGLVSFSEVQMRAFSRYFLFQVLNVFLVTTIAGSIFDTMAIILDSPETVFEMLGNSLPRMSSFFITFVTIKTFLGLGMELVRTMSLVQATIRYLLLPSATLRMSRTIFIGLRPIDDPGWFPFHKILAQDMLVVVISVVFAVVAPLVLLPCALFCLFSRIMWTHHHLYVYESVFETGGQFWPKIFRRFVFGLIIAQMTITGQFILKEARHEAYATIALIFMTYFFLRSTRARYDPSSSTLPLEVATVMDISLSQEEEAIRRAHRLTKQGPAAATDQDDRRTQTTSSNPESGDMEQDIYDHNLGIFIGRYDPFKRAYLQPALRANPRARPEQPFPPNQLGRIEVLQQPTEDEQLLHSSGATVRLKGMNQQNRRLVNRWWNDQLQRCGDQSIVNVLIGEECGSLTIGRRANLVELSGRHEMI